MGGVPIFGEDISMKASTQTKAELIKEIDQLRAQLKETEKKLFTIPETQAQSSEITARLILDQATDMTIVCDEYGRISWASEVTRRYIGAKFLLRPFDEIVKLRFSSSNPLRDKDFSVSDVLNGKTFRREEVVLQRGGEGSHFLLSARPLADQHGRIHGCVVTLTDITERKQMEAELARLASFPQLNPNPVVEVDPAGQVEYSNAAAERLFPGLKKAGRNHPWLSDLEKISETLKTGPGKTYVRELRVEDLWYQQTIHSVMEGSRIRIYGFDITQRKRAEDAAQASEKRAYDQAARLQAMLDTAPAIIWTASDRECREIAGNRASYVFLRVPEGTDMSKSGPAPERLAHYRVLKDGVELTAREMPIQRVAASGQGLSDYAMELVFDDGTVRSVLGNINPVLDSAGQPNGAIAAFIDITAHREAEMKYSKILATALSGFWITDVQGKLLEVNDALCRMLGYTREELLTLSIADVEADENPANVLNHILALRQKQFDRFVSRHRRKDGSIIDVEVNSTWLDIGEGQLVGIMQDITERKHAEMLSNALNDINLIINSTLDSDEIMNRAVVQACKAIGAESAAISLRKVDGWVVSYGYHFPGEIIGEKMTDEEDPHAAISMKTRQVVFINDAFNDQRVNREHMRKYNVRSVMVIPLVTKEKATGVLFLNYHMAPITFNKAQIDFAEKLGATLSLVMENAKLFEVEKKNKERFEILSETASRLLATHRPQEVLNALCQKVMTYLDCHAFFNYLVDEEKQRLHLNAYAGIPEETGKEIEWLDYGVAVCGCAARDASRIVCESIPTTPDPRTERVKSFGIKAYACHPLLSAGRVIGTLSFGTRSRPTFTEDELSLMKTVADQVAVAMERIQLIDALKRSRDELEVRVQERTREVREQSRVLDYFFKFSITPFVILDKDFDFIRVNEAYAKACHRKASEFPGHNHFEFYPSDAKAKFEQVVRTRQPFVAIARPFSFPDHPEWGVTYWDWILTPILNDAGEVEYLVFSLEDVTKRRQADEAVKKERQRFYDVLEMLPAYLVLLTPDYHVPFANRFFRERFGESHGNRCFEYLFNRSEPCEICETYTVLKTIAPHHWEWTGPDGRIYDVSDFPFTDTDGSVSILEMGIDITERKRAEEALRAAHQYNRSLIEASLDPLLTINSEGKVTDVNSATELATGVTREQLIGSDFSDYFADPEKAREGYRTAFLKGTARDYPLAIRHRSGMITDVLYNATIYRNEAGEIQGVFAAARDITERKRAEEALKESEVRLRALSSQLLTAQESERKRIAMELHDGVGQMLTAIKFKVENTVQEMGEGKARTKNKSLEAIIPMIKNTIDEVRKMQMDLRPSTLDDLGVLATLGWFCREYQKIYSRIRIEKEIAIEETEVSAPLKVVLYRLTQEAMNNIAKHSQADLVRLTLRKQETQIEWVIEDNGMGFDLEYVLSSGQSKRGLGLGSMKERAELSGGTFAIESIKGKGTTVRASWPV